MGLPSIAVACPAMIAGWAGSESGLAIISARSAMAIVGFWLAFLGPPGYHRARYQERQFGCSPYSVPRGQSARGCWLAVFVFRQLVTKKAIQEFHKRTSIRASPLGTPKRLLQD